MRKRLDPLGERGKHMKGLAVEIETFLLHLEASPVDLVEFVNDRVAYLNRYRSPSRKKLSDGAKAVLLASDYSVVQEVMSYRETQAVRWICIWVI
jgi:hypothetical protein